MREIPLRPQRRCKAAADANTTTAAHKVGQSVLNVRIQTVSHSYVEQLTPMQS